MRSVRRTGGVVFGAAGLLSAAAAFAQTTYYVAPPAAGGSDGNPGTAALPWATLQRAANGRVPGDTVIVLPGTYTGFNVGVSGTPAAPITFRGTRGAGGEWLSVVNVAAATFNGQAHKARINLDTASWIVIEDFEVTGSNDQRVSKAGVRAVGPPGTSAGNIAVRRCHIHHNGEWGIFTGHVNAMLVEQNLIHEMWDEHGVYLSNSGDNHIVRDNVIWGNSSNGLHVNSDASQGGDGVMTNVLVERNVLYSNGGGSMYINGSGVLTTSNGGGSAVNFDGVRDSVIRNNLMYDNRASGISLYRIDGAQGAGNNLVVNNTIINAATGRWCVNISDGSTNNTVFNNILLNYHSFRGAMISSADSLPGLVSDYNIVINRFDAGGGVITLAQWRAQTGQDVHSTALASGSWAALFENLAASDYRLAEASLARNAGVAALNGRFAPVDDLLGLARPREGAFDIGAYEFDVGAPCAVDYDGDGSAGVPDIFEFLTLWFADDAAADFNGSGGEPTVEDIFEFLTAWFAGC